MVFLCHQFTLDSHWINRTGFGEKKDKTRKVKQMGQIYINIFVVDMFCKLIFTLDDSSNMDAGTSFKQILGFGIN